MTAVVCCAIEKMLLRRYCEWIVLIQPTNAVQTLLEVECALDLLPPCKSWVLFFLILGFGSGVDFFDLFLTY